MRHRRIASAVVLGLGVGVLFGCNGAGSTDVFLEKYLDRYCLYRHKCYQGDFNAAFSNVRDCIDTKLEYKGFDDFADDCDDYDPKEAEECLTWLEQERSPCGPIDADFFDKLDDNCSNVCSNIGFLVDLGGYALEGEFEQP